MVALDSVQSSGLIERSRVSQEEVRLYQLTAPADPARRDALGRLMTLADSHTVRLLLGRGLQDDRPDQNEKAVRLRGVGSSES